MNEHVNTIYIEVSPQEISHVKEKEIQNNLMKPG